MARKVIIMQGPSGAGKTTYVKKNYPEAAVFSADDFFVIGGEYKFDPRLLSKAHGECLRRYISWFTWNDLDRKVVVVDNTNTTPVEMAPYIAIAEAYGVPHEIISIEIDPDDAAERNIHSVPVKTVWEQHHRMMQNVSRIPRWWKITKVKAE